MRIGELINLYKRMRAALLVSVPLALWWVMYLYSWPLPLFCI